MGFDGLSLANNSLSTDVYFLLRVIVLSARSNGHPVLRSGLFKSPAVSTFSCDLNELKTK